MALHDTPSVTSAALRPVSYAASTSETGSEWRGHSLYPNCFSLCQEAKDLHPIIPLPQTRQGRWAREGVGWVVGSMRL